MILEYEVDFSESKESIDSVKSKPIPYTIITIVGLILIVIGFLLHDNPAEKYSIRGIIAFFGFVIFIFFFQISIGLWLGVFTKSSIIGAKYNIDENRIDIRFKYKNKLFSRFSNFLDNLYRFYYYLWGAFPSLRFHPNIIPLKTIKSIEYSSYNGKKSAFILYLVEWGWIRKVRFTQAFHLILPDKNPKEIYGQLESWVSNAKSSGYA